MTVSASKTEPIVEQIIAALRVCGRGVFAREDCKECCLMGMWDRDFTLSDGQPCFDHLDLVAAGALERLNDFQSSQCAKLLETVAELRGQDGRSTGRNHEGGAIMNPLVDITVSLFFEVKESEMFGGTGSVGYASTKFDSVENLSAVDDSFISRQIEVYAQMLGVSVANITLISKEAYDLATAENEEHFEDDDDYEEDDDEWPTAVTVAPL